VAVLELSKGFVEKRRKKTKRRKAVFIGERNERTRPHENSRGMFWVKSKINVGIGGALEVYRWRSIDDIHGVLSTKRRVRNKEEEEPSRSECRVRDQEADTYCEPLLVFGKRVVRLWRRWGRIQRGERWHL
jgi:hypothetical protein